MVSPAEEDTLRLFVISVPLLRGEQKVLINWNLKDTVDKPKHRGR